MRKKPQQQFSVNTSCSDYGHVYLYNWTVGRLIYLQPSRWGFKTNIIDTPIQATAWNFLNTCTPHPGILWTIRTGRFNVSHPVIFIGDLTGAGHQLIPVGLATSIKDFPAFFSSPIKTDLSKERQGWQWFSSCDMLLGFCAQLALQHCVHNLAFFGTVTVADWFRCQGQHLAHIGMNDDGLKDLMMIELFAFGSGQQAMGTR